MPPCSRASLSLLSSRYARDSSCLSGLQTASRSVAIKYSMSKIGILGSYISSWTSRVMGFSTVIKRCWEIWINSNESCCAYFELLVPSHISQKTKTIGELCRLWCPSYDETIIVFDLISFIHANQILKHPNEAFLFRKEMKTLHFQLHGMSFYIKIHTIF